MNSKTMNMNDVFIVAGSKLWNHRVFDEVIVKFHCLVLGRLRKR